MERSLLDTDTFSELLRGHHASICRRAEAYLDVFGRFTISATSIAELVDGLRRRQREQEIETLVAKLRDESHEILAIDFQTAIMAGRIFGDLYRAGRPIGRSDPFIAAVDLAAGIPLVSGNIEHFQRIQDLGYPLQLESWHGG